MIVEPLGRFVFVSTNVGLFVYTIDGTTGELIAASSNPYSEAEGSMAVDPSGKCLYIAPIATTAGNYIDAYQIDQRTGTLTPVPGSPFPGDQASFPTSIVIDPLGRFVYVTNVGSPAFSSVSAYKLVGSTGALSQIKGSPFTSPVASKGVVWLTFHASRAFADWLDGSGAVTTYSIDAKSGALQDGIASVPASPWSGSHTGDSGPLFHMAGDPSGKFLFVVNEGPFDAETSPSIANYIAINAIDPNTGSLTQSNDSPYYAHDLPNPSIVKIYASP